MSPRNFAHSKLAIITTAAAGIHNLCLLQIHEVKSNITVALSNFYWFALRLYYAVKRNLAPCLVDYDTPLVLSIAVLEIFQTKLGGPNFTKNTSKLKKWPGFF